MLRRFTHRICHIRRYSAKVNRLATNKQNNWLNNREENKIEIGEEGPRRSALAPQVNQDIQQGIYATNNTKEIVAIIQENAQAIEHTSIFGKAMPTA